LLPSQAKMKKPHFKEKICKSCAGTFKAYKSTAQVCSTKCAIDYAEVKRKAAEKREWNKRKQKLNAELETIQVLVKKAQAVFNTWIRERDCERTCISCGTQLNDKYDAGHYHNANNHWSVRFNEDNVHGQCVKCNQHLSGNLINYRKGLLTRIGPERLAKLDAIANLTRNFDKFELRAIIEKYKIKKK